MALGTNPEEDFEDVYTSKICGLLGASGTLIEYKRDRAAIDLGLHLAVQGRTTQARVWFQLKGVHATTLPLERLAATKVIRIEVELEHLRFWYAFPEAVYLAVYLEATDEFIAEDVRDVVDRQWGQAFWQSGTFRENQQEVTVRLQKTAKFNKGAVEGLLRHRSMRIDGPQWRGRPLGHRLDPLRSALAPLKSNDYVSLVESLLQAHGFEEQERLEANLILPDMIDSQDEATLIRGRMHYTYEWTHPLFTQFGIGDDPFRIEGGMFHVQGDCLMLIHAKGDTRPKQNAELAAIAQQHGIKQLLVFVNRPQEAKTIGAYRVAAEPLECLPQDLDSFAFNVLTATSIYLDFRDKLGWRVVNYLP